MITSQEVGQTQESTPNPRKDVFLMFSHRMHTELCSKLILLTHCHNAQKEFSWQLYEAEVW